MDEQILIDRPPRIQPELPFAQIEIPAPPTDEDRGLAQLIQMALPMVTILGLLFVTASGGGRSVLIMIPMGLSVVAAVGLALYSYRMERRKREQIRKTYRSRLLDLNKEMHTYHDQQRRFYRYSYPDVKTIWQIAERSRISALAKERPLRAEARLWERRVTDHDFGFIRLGMGTLPSTVIYTLSQAENQEDPLVREAVKLYEDSQFVHDIPVVISLRHHPSQRGAVATDADLAENEAFPHCPATHALGIAGDNAGDVYEFVRALIGHYVVFHQPDDARLYLLGAKPEPWAWLMGLPHCQSDEPTSCFAADLDDTVAQNPLADDDSDKLEGFLESLRRLVSTRKIRMQDRDESELSAASTLPHLLVIVDLLDVATGQYPRLDNLEADAAISILLEEGAALGATVIFLTPERAKIPSRCTAIIEVERTTPATSSRVPQLEKIHFRYTETGVNSTRYVGTADYAYLRQMPDLVKLLAQLKVQQGYGANVPATVPFLSLMEKSSLSHLLADTSEQWLNSVKPDKRYANWLRARIGIMSGNKARTLVFAANKDGVHGMVAGSTGSGKSELLISLISSLAVTYAPSVLNFVLVDYKGGGAFKGLDKLPHVVDTITNLQRDGVTRMFTAIQSELKRRQAINVRTETKNIVDYRRRGFHETEPYPFLFIIIDEFAEMIADRPEFKKELETITRVGRAQGVSLILAAQRPSGVTDQMRSNIKFRICLRVETTSESREMLRRDDAAYLPGSIPGRGYLQVGNDEIELFQAAYTGEKYIDPTQPLLPVLWPDRDTGYDERVDQEPPELYQVIGDQLQQLANTQGIPLQGAPWPDPLPDHFALNDALFLGSDGKKPVTAPKYLKQRDRILLGAVHSAADPLALILNPAINQWLNGERGWVTAPDWLNYAMRPVVGLVDDPVEAQQLPLVVDLPAGHVAIFGGSGWGKTTLIRTLLISLAATYSPDHLHIYLLDFGGGHLNHLANLPHVGAVISPEAPGYQERVDQLMRQLEEFVDERKRLLNEVEPADIYTYNLAYPANALPAIVVAIDNFVEFRETFAGRDDDIETALDKLVTLARQSRAYGIHVLISASRTADIPYQLFNIFTERFSFKLADPTEYRGIVGGAVDDFTGIPGRGYTKIGATPLAFQVAQAFAPGRQGSQGQAIGPFAQFCQSMENYLARSSHTYRRPIEIEALPEKMLFKEIFARSHEMAQEMAVDNVPTLQSATMEERTPELSANFRAEMRRATSTNWAQSLDPQLAAWLEAPIGVISGNRLRALQLEAKQDGVHGLVAGGTGAGKSELLMTLIVGLALRYDPSVLNFVLIDYKGGGAFQPFAELPHVVDLVTNLNKSAVRRMFTAINAEMQRRQQLNAETETKDIVEYRAKGYHKDRPYPHLFIIIDEYAEMISESPEFKAELESIARLGRAQGLNLLLASQRPTGITDQMRANIKYRICLRVEEMETSREMLRRPDAALLPNGMPGRGYLQVGNETVELIQVAYTGESYQNPGDSADDRPQKFYDIAVALTNELLTSERPNTPWPQPLPNRFTLLTPQAVRYRNDTYRSLLTLGRAVDDIRNAQGTLFYQLNPFVGEWLAGRSAWQGINWETDALRAIVGLVDDPHNACQLPLVVDFTKGHVVLFGASGWGKTTFLRTLVTSLAATHSPDEFQAHVLDLGGRNLDVLKYLPHVGTIIMPDEKGYEERVQQLLRELNDEVNERKKRFSAVNAQTLYEYNQRPSQEPLPAILILVDNFAEFLDTFGGHEEDETNPLEMLVALIRQAKSYGLHFIVTVTRLNVLSNKLLSLFAERLTLRLTDVDEYRAIVGGQVSEIDEIPGRGYVKVGRVPLEFQTALAVGHFKGDTATDQADAPVSEFEFIERLGQQMRVVGANSWSGARPLRIEALDRSLAYRDLLKRIFQLSAQSHFLDELQQAVQSEWQRTASAKEADWLSTTLGVVSGGRPRALHFSAKTDGVHGLIAGGTGSGKSELLMTLIVGLALNYAPDILNFVLVDYKGGGAFKPFEGLPHCVDLITNLNKAAVNRMFTAINAEMRRRQRLNADTGTKDIIEYRQKGLHLNGGQSYPHLFIIIDEYAEMIEDNPDYRAELESITRVGRAQGVNLILASQRPIGVSDQMRANIKLRLCLRVEQTDTSHELLRRKDAAYLPSIPGRGYIQVGNENLELIQVAYAGDPQSDVRPEPVVWPDRPKMDATANSLAEDLPRLFDLVVSLTKGLNGGKMAARLWPNFLPPQFSLQSPLYDAQHDHAYVLNDAVTDWLNGEYEGLWPGLQWASANTAPSSEPTNRDGSGFAPTNRSATKAAALYPVVGLLDDPAEARQYPLAFNLLRTHLAVHGDSGMGKSSFLRTLLISLLATHSPNELHAYILDLGGRSFAGFERFPHVGALLYADEETFEERLQRLMEKLEQMVEDRQQLISDAGANGFSDYNERNSAQSLPAVLLLIDNFAELTESHETLLELVIMPLLRRASGVGIAFVATSNIPNSIPNKIYSLFGERITLKQNNFDRYIDIVGRGAVELDDIPGRGYRRIAGRPLLLQVALPVGLFDPQNGRDRLSEALQVERMAEQMNARLADPQFIWRNRPEAIHTLQEYVALDDLFAEVALPGEAEQSRRIEVVLGRDVRLTAATFNLKRLGPHFAVVGPPLSGKTTVLYNLIFSLAERYSPAQATLVLVDLQRRLVDYGGAHRLDELPHVAEVVYEVEAIAPLLERLHAECLALAKGESAREIFVIIDDFDDFSDQLEKHHSVGRDFANLARRYGRDGLHVVIAGMLESSSSELRRQVRSANYGIGLRSAQALDTLGVMRRPPGLQDRELAFGRGYIVKSGQSTMIQIASPYGNLGFGSETVEDELLEAAIQRALDGWVKRLVAHHPGSYPKWAGSDGAPVGDGARPPAMDPTVQRGLMVLRQLIQDRVGDSNGAIDDPAVLAEAIKAIFGKEEEGAWIFTASPEDVFATAETKLETRLQRNRK